MSYAPLEPTGADAFERDLLETWRAERLFQCTLDATAEGRPFVFYEGPPTANGRPGVHHVFARTIKDLICRFHTMRGRSVTRIAGWDTHGLPVEIEVEKALALSGKADIERFGVAEFNARCRESVFTYKADWEALSERIGYWLDYSRPYVTYTNEYIETVWWLLKQLHERNLLYQGYKVLPYCPRCGTALSSHELAQGYETHKSPSIHVLFEVTETGGQADSRTDGRSEERSARPPVRPSDRPTDLSARPPVRPPARYLLVWTTTPWTLPSNVAIAVHPDFTYVEHEVDGRRIIAERAIAGAKAIPGATHGRPLAEFPQTGQYTGRDLVGWRYRQLLDAVPVTDGKAFLVVPADFVTNEEGTGLVHLAPAFGADDFTAGQREGLAFVNPVDAAGRFTGTDWEEINGKSVFDANAVIAERLEREGKVFGRYQPEGYEHTYPFCWRCDSPLIYYARQSWFVRTTAYRDRMLAINREVDWTPPEVGSGRFGEWLENNVDWALSRDRYWGTPLPVWVCDADPAHRVVVGSYAELAELSGRPLPADFDPHKPFVDAYIFGCRAPQCAGTLRRVPQVIDAWFDSGAMPYAQWHYPFEQVGEFRGHFPAEFICEGLDQTRGWFYSLLAIAAGVSDGAAYRHVIVNGMVLDAQGRKMSKHVGNVANPWDAVSQFGADAVRLYLLTSSHVWLPKRFDPDAIRDVATGFVNRLRHTYNFFALYAGEWTPGSAPPVERRPPVDRWLLRRLGALVETVAGSWTGFDVTTGARAIMDFCDNDLSNWYVRVNRSRFWAPDAEADPAALATLHEALVTVTRLLAPAAPFASDAIHRRLTGASVHLAGFPEPHGAAPERDLDPAMDAVRRLATLARAARETVGLRVRQPLAAMRVAVPRDVHGPAFDAFLAILADEVNVKDVRVVASDEELVRLRGKPNYRSLGKVYGKRTPAAAAAVPRLPSDLLQRLEAGQTVEFAGDGEPYRYRAEDVVVEREVASDWLVQSDGPLVVALDPTLSEDLKREGLAREIVNRVQRLRKEAGYDYNTRIELGIAGAAEVVAAATAYRDSIAGETLARRLDVGAELDGADVRETVDLDGRAVVLSLRRHGRGERKRTTPDGTGREAR